MRAALRRALSGCAIALAVASAFAWAAETATTFRQSRNHIATLEVELKAGIRAREQRIGARQSRNFDATPLFKARTVTMAGAALQQRFEAAVVAANGRLVTSNLEVAPRSDARRLALFAELTIAEPDMQALLFDLESGSPYLFVDVVDVHALESTNGSGQQMLHVSLAASGAWSGAK